MAPRHPVGEVPIFVESKRWGSAVDDHCRSQVTVVFVFFVCVFVSLQKKGKHFKNEKNTYTLYIYTPRLPNTCSEGVLGCFRYVFGVQIPSHKVFGSLG